MKKIFLFDVDGVVVDGPSWARNLEQDWGISPSQRQEFFRTDFSACLLGKADVKVVLEPYLKRWGHSGKVDAFLEYWFSNDASVNKDLLDIVGALRESGPCYLATNQEKQRTRYLMETLQLKAHFDGVFACWELGSPKPEAAFFESVTIRLDIKHSVSAEPLDIIFIDDSLANVRAAEKFGWKVHHYTSFSGFQEWLVKSGLYPAEATAQCQ